MKFLYTSIFIFLSLFTFASPGSFTIKGTVVDSSDSKAVELATVALKSADGIKIIAAITTDENGKFVLDKIDAGKYQLLISFVGYMSKTTSIEVNGNTTLKAIKLRMEGQTLGGAEIVSEKSLIVKTAEKTVYNVAGSPTNQVGTLEDVLRNMPGVSVDQNGGVSITGKQGVVVLVDGRPNALASSDLPAFLKSIPASSIEAIEVITNPSAKYDADGNAGVINIKLKKGKADGLNGTANIGYGILNRYNGSLNINYRKNKVNVFGNYSLNYSKNKSVSTGDRTTTVNDTTTHYNSGGTSIYSGLGNNLKAGFDYFIDDKNTFTYTLGGNYRKSWSTGNSNSTNLDSAENLLTSNNSATNGLRSNYTISNSINYQKKFDSTDRELDVYGSYSYVISNNNNTLINNAFEVGGLPDLANTYQRPTVTDNYTHSGVFQLDYIHPLRRLKGYKIEIGAKDVITSNNNVFNVSNVVNNISTHDTLLSNHFNYTENVAAIYGIMRGSWSKWLTYSAGLRTEYAYIRSNNSSLEKGYLDFFPNASLGISITDEQSLSFSYSRRIQRPSFWSLNNAISYNDPYSTYQGNPYLKPLYTNVVSMSYSISVKKQYFSLDANGYFQNGGFSNSYYTDSAHVTHTSTINAGEHNSFTINQYSRLKFTKWWDFQMSHNFNYNYYAYSPGVNTSSFHAISYSFWCNMDFKFWKNMTIEIGGWVNTPTVQQQGKQGALGSVWASIKKSFLKDKLTASISAQDIFQTLKSTSSTSAPGFYSANTWQYFDRCVTFTLSYRFGTSNQVHQKREKGSNDRLDGGEGQ